MSRVFSRVRGRGAGALARRGGRLTLLPLGPVLTAIEGSLIRAVVRGVIVVSRKRLHIISRIKDGLSFSHLNDF